MGFTSVISYDALNRVHRMTDQDLNQYPELGTVAALLRNKAASRSQVAPHGVIFSDPSFKGTLYLAQLTFKVGSNTFLVSNADIETIRQYLTAASPVISRYCSLYGSNSLRVSSQILKQTVDVPSGKYDDDALVEWIRNLLKTQVPLSGVANSCVIVLNPPGVINSDAATEGFLGYHSELNFNTAGGGFGTGGPMLVPYCYVVVDGQNLTMADRNRHYATTPSHEVAEMTVNPFACHTNPEVCDDCAANCLKNANWTSFFTRDTSGNYGYVASGKGIIEQPYDFYIAAITKPSNVGDCPVPDGACAYAPNDLEADESELQVVGVGGDGKLWHTIRNAAGGWTGFGLVQQVARGGPAAFIDISSRSEDG